MIAAEMYPPVTMTRAEKLLAHIELETDVGLEIGALCYPIVPPDNPGISYVDHLSTGALRAKYESDPAVDIERIVPVSFVWTNCTLKHAVRGKKFDYVIASHVIEHAPDLIGWLRQISDVLRPGGILALAIPDKRYTFDCLRAPTSIGTALEAFCEGRERPSLAQVVDSLAYQANVPGQMSHAMLWNERLRVDDMPLNPPSLLTDVGAMGWMDHWRQIRDGRYIDAHCSAFSPHSFLALLRQIIALRLLPMGVLDFHDTLEGDTEFFVILRRASESGATPEQIRRLLASIPVVTSPVLNATEVLDRQGLLRYTSDPVVAAARSLVSATHRERTEGGVLPDDAAQWIIKRHKDLIFEDDWSFVIKLHAMVEKLLVFALREHFRDAGLDDLIGQQTFGDADQGLLGFVARLEWLDADDVCFIDQLTRLRRALMQSPTDGPFSLEATWELLGKQQQPEEQDGIDLKAWIWGRVRETITNLWLRVGARADGQLDTYDHSVSATPHRPLDSIVSGSLSANASATKETSEPAPEPPAMGTEQVQRAELVTPPVVVEPVALGLTEAAVSPDSAPHEPGPDERVPPDQRTEQPELLAPDPARPSPM